MTDNPDYLDEPFQKAQSELAAAEIAFIEATARVEQAREASERLEAAVAALSGETTVGPLAQETETSTPVLSDARAAAQALSPEEFDKERKRKQRARQQEEIDLNPHGHMKCPGCGVTGKMTESTLTTEGGGIVRMLVCGGCRNQQLI